MKHTKVILLAAAALLLNAGAALATPADDAFQHGQIFAANKEYDKAISAYLEAAGADPDKYGIKANMSVAIVLGQKKEYEKAAKVLEMIIDKYPEYPNLWLCYKILGKVRQDQKRPADAIAAYETYLKTIPAEKLTPKDKDEVSKQIALLRKQAQGN